MRPPRFSSCHQERPPNVGCRIHIVSDPRARGGLSRQGQPVPVSSHPLGDFRRCPLLYRKKLGLVADEDRPAYLMGRAVHTLMLEGRAVWAEYAVGGPINPKTGELYGATTKAFAEWTAAHGKEVLTVDQFDLIESMADGVRENAPPATSFPGGHTGRRSGRRVPRYPRQTRMDFFDPHEGVVDLKTCDDLSWFETDARRHGYVHQLAFYRAASLR